MKQAYISAHLADARSAAARFHLNPIVLLAQAALESGWGTSRLAREANNHFGITGYGASNAFWHGGRVTARYKRGELLFRRYDSARNSYLDFARLLVRSYPQAAAMSRLRQGHRLQPLHQRAERRQPGTLPGDAGTALPRDRTDLLIPNKPQLI